MKMTPSVLSIALIALFSSIVFSSAWANMGEIKKYKEAFPDEKAKCATCHVDAMPKKDGNHDLNEYGKKVVSINEKPVVETYKTAGKA